MGCVRLYLYLRRLQHYINGMCVCAYGKFESPAVVIVGWYEPVQCVHEGMMWGWGVEYIVLEKKRSSSVFIFVFVSYLYLYLSLYLYLYLPEGLTWSEGRGWNTLKKLLSSWCMGLHWAPVGCLAFWWVALPCHLAGLPWASTDLKEPGAADMTVTNRCAADCRLIEN